MNMQQMLQQAQQMQKKFQQAQDAMADREFTGQAGGGVVSVTIDGEGDVQGIDIEPDVVDSDDVDMLEDLVVSAFQAAQQELDEAQSEAFEDMGLPMDQMGNLGNLLG